MYIAERFEKEVLLHVFKNISTQFENSPLILGIQGPPGEGKTYQLNKLFDKYNFKAVYISVGELESNNAGEPASLIRKKYIECAEYMEKGFLSALIINDIDTGIGNFGPLVQTTINTQQLIGQLMDLADRPNIIGSSISIKRVPIIFTGNDFNKLYGPLIREGRMINFEWIATIEEKTQMIRNVFPKLDESDIIELYNSLLVHNNMISISISFFSHLSSLIYDDIIWNSIKHVKNKNKLVTDLLDGGKYQFKDVMDINIYIEKGKYLLDSKKIKNHIN